jgi:integrase
MVVGYSVYLGRQGDQPRQRRFFVDRSEAEKFIQEQDTTPIPLGELWERKAEILYNLERLRVVKSSLTDVVTFYLSNIENRSDRKLADVVTEFLEEKQRVGRSVQYDKSMRYALHHFLDHVGQDRPLAEITRQIVSDYVYVTHKHVGPVTKRNLLINISVLLNFAVKRDYLSENPVSKIDRPSVQFAKPKVIVPSDFEILLRTCLDRGWNERLLLFVLVGFCGIRVEEASKLTWGNLNLKRGVVEVPHTIAKKASFRNNPIPPNAMEWFRKVEDKRRTGPIIGPNWKNLLRSAVRISGIKYEKNGVRHSFCSYALASGWTLADVVACMGHGGNPTMVFSHYRNVVSEEDGKKWFSIVP